MKRNLLALSLAVFFGLGMASCRKCTTCSDCDQQLTDESGNEVDEVEICEDDAASKEEYEAAISVFEAFGGCTCK